MTGQRRILDIGPWTEDAACRDKDPNLFFLEEGEVYRVGRFDEAREICRTCIVRFDCDTYATQSKEKWGVWAQRDRGEKKHAERVAREEEERAEERSRVLGVDVHLPGGPAAAEVRVALAGESAGSGTDRRSA